MNGDAGEREREREEDDEESNESFFCENDGKRGIPYDKRREERGIAVRWALHLAFLIIFISLRVWVEGKKVAFVPADCRRYRPSFGSYLRCNIMYINSQNTLHRLVLPSVTHCFCGKEFTRTTCPLVQLA